MSKTSPTHLVSVLAGFFAAVGLLATGCGGTGKSGTGGTTGGPGGDGGKGAGGSGARGGTMGGSGAGGSGAGGSSGSGGPGGSGAGGSGAGGSGAGGTGVSPGTMTLNPPANGAVPTTPVACAMNADAGAFTFDRIGVWRDDAESAYTMIHDDMCGPGLRGIDKYAVPALAMRGLGSGMGPFVDVCEQAKLWDMVADAEAKGNEIINHSYSHPNISVANAPKEVVMAKKVFDSHLKNPISFYVFPYDYWTAETLQAVANAGHIGARAGVRDMFDGFDNPPINKASDNSDASDLGLVFDVWPRSYSKYALYAAKDLLNIHVYNAIKAKGFAVREFHSISGNVTPKEDGSEGFGPVPLRVFEEHLDFLVNAWKANKVWTSTPSTIVRYRRARQACTASVANNTITFATPNPTCMKYATPISIIVKTAKDVPGIKAMQGAAAVMTRKLGPSLFSVTADPTKGNVMLGGCATASPAVDATVTLPPVPVRAKSVCDLELVKGMGGKGQMDTLERDMAFFQALPNPQQQDGRTGSWSWYPGGAVGVIVKEGTNSVLKWSGGGYNAWAGVTLAFLGGNGAGACYDASAYQGIRFKIKGTVTTTDLFNNTVFVRLITAATQTQKYGGDLMGEGGHFGQDIKVTPEWQTISIPWAMLNPPNWGATMSLTTFPVGQLQAIDWGISDKSSMFDLYLDDIELY